MNMQQIELIAKALAPVIKEYAQSAVEKSEKRQKAEFERMDLVLRAEKLEQNRHFAAKLAEIEQRIPQELDKTALLEEFKALIPDEVSLDGYIKQIDAELLIEEKSLSLREDLQAVIDKIPVPKDGATVDDLLPQIEAAISDKMADITPQPGIDGRDGKDGVDGKDAIQIEILPDIDMEKSYPRGTFAQHNGGVIRAWQQTQGEKGWETVWNGVSRVEIEQSDARKAVIALYMTDGSKVEKTFNFPGMIYKGVYRAGDTYNQGDTATFGGSLWYCDTDTDEKPGVGKCWVLCAKKGRDGK